MDGLDHPHSIRRDYGSHHSVPTRDILSLTPKMEGKASTQSNRRQPLPLRNGHGENPAIYSDRRRTETPVPHYIPGTHHPLDLAIHDCPVHCPVHFLRWIYLHLHRCVWHITRS